MGETNHLDLTQRMHLAERGDPQAKADVIEAAYNDLWNLAKGRMAGERQDHTLTSTALVNEVSMKLLVDSGVPMGNRAQFFGYVARAMRNLLVDHARSRGRQKRGGNQAKFEFQEAMVAADHQSEDLLELNEALESLGEFDPRKVQVVEMRYFGGMANQEIATALNVSLSTVKRDWEVAKTWLLRELTREANQVDQ